ncbi:MAG: M23 family metallopeptidase [Acidobacteriota bacterium]
MTRTLLFVCLLGLFTVPALAQDFDTDATWPLCGRIADDPPSTWNSGDDCPSGRFGKSEYHDGPIASPFGPRQHTVTGYDFHRGIDLATDRGTPVFAIADGTVYSHKVTTSGIDERLVLRHYRPTESSCSGGGGCYFSEYGHLASVEVSTVKGVQVFKGDLIGYSGESTDTGFEHLHFAIMNAPSHDSSSAWYRDAIHPLNVLPYDDSDGTPTTDGYVHNMKVTATLDTTGPLATPAYPRVTADIEMDHTIELDLVRVEVALFYNTGQGFMATITQPGDTASTIYTTDSGIGYWVEPTFYDMEVWNRQYSYKNSNNYPWRSFAEEPMDPSAPNYDPKTGAYQSPYWASLPSSYNGNVHMDDDDFNGIEVTSYSLGASAPTYQLSMTFTALETGLSDGSPLCAKVTAIDVNGNEVEAEDGNCT